MTNSLNIIPAKYSWNTVCPAPRDVDWTPELSTAKSLGASTVAFRPGSHISESISTPSADDSTWNNLNTPLSSSDIHLKLDNPIDLTGHILSPFFIREFVYQGCHFHSIAHLMCYRYAVLQGLKTFTNSIRKWVKHLTDFPTPRFQTPEWQVQCRSAHGAKACCSVIGCGTSAWSYIVAKHVLLAIRSCIRPESVPFDRCSGVFCYLCYFRIPEIYRRIYDYLLITTLPGF